MVSTSLLKGYADISDYGSLCSHVDPICRSFKIIYMYMHVHGRNRDGVFSDKISVKDPQRRVNLIVVSQHRHFR